MTQNVRFFKRKSIWRQTIPSWCDTVPSIFFLCPYDPAPVFHHGCLLSVTLKRHCSLSRRWIRLCWSSPAREMGDVGHSHTGGISSIWNSILHLMIDLHLRAKEGSSLKLGSGADEKKRDYIHFHCIFHIYTSQYLVASCS